MRKNISMLIAISMILCALTACGKADNTTTEASTAAPTSTLASEATNGTTSTVAYPLTTEDVTFTWMHEGSPLSTGDTIDSKAYEEITKVTGVKFEHKYLTMETGKETFNLMIASGDYTDFITGMSKYYTRGIDDAIEGDIIINMDQPIKDYMPNYYAVVSSDEETLKQSLTDSGILWGVHHISNETQAPFRGPVIRQDWLDKCNLSTPVTISDWENVLTAFKTNISTAAGGPLLLATTGFMSDSTTPTYTLTSAFNTGTADTPFIQIDGKVQYSPASEGYKKYIELMTDWYSKGLVYTDFTSLTGFGASDTLIYNGSIGVLDGMYNDLDTQQQSAEDSDFLMKAITPPVEKEGDTLHLRNYSYRVRTDYSTVISTDCKNVELACKALDYMWSEEGILLCNYGINGETYTLDENGDPQWTDMVLNNEQYTLKDMITLYSVFNGSTFNYWARETSGLSDNCLSCADVWSVADSSYGMPKVTLTLDESEEYGNINGDLSTYVQEMALKFITGAEPLSNYDSYLETLKSLNYDAIVEIEQNALDRYNTR